MKKGQWFIWIVLICLAGITSVPQVMAQRQGVGMVTGGTTGTYIKFGQQIAEYTQKAGLNIIVKASEGSVDNIERLVSKENAAFAIVQSDVLGFIKRSDNPELQAVAKKLRLIFPFYNEEVHLFANKEIQRFEDLQGKRVVLSTKGSGTWMTARNLLDITGVEPERLYMSSAEGVEAVLMGEADAAFYVAGKPVKLFTHLDQVKAEFPDLIENVHFVPLNDPGMLEEYVSSEIRADDYNWFDQTIPTIAVKAVLISFDFSSKRNAYYRQRCQQLATLGQVIRDNIGQLKQTGHPKWQEVDLNEKIGLWEPDACSRTTQPIRQPTGRKRVRELLELKP